ncbi:Leucine-rich repeat protein kinase family protein [Hibiscus syriacus]|uniref:glycine--tRNA ligase n=1 Tax=Hibiscus syriacus TaxID=106335 RepID=A0A6A3ANH1_HIBSY|nr:Leucine-rich repeat protein kinase family protein [Hibiscus syriacus]
MATLAPTPLSKHPLSSSPKVFDSRVQSGEIQLTQFRFWAYFSLASGFNFLLRNYWIVENEKGNVPILSNKAPLYIPSFECRLGHQIVKLECIFLLELSLFSCSLYLLTDLVDLLLVKLPAVTSFYRTGEVSGQLERTGKPVGHVCWVDNDVINGKPTGAVRVSIGYMSTYEDAKVLMLVNMIYGLSRTIGRARKEMSAYYLEHASVGHIQKHFDFFEEEARSLLASRLSIPAYDQLLKTSHVFNILDSRGCVGISVENLCPKQAENELKVGVPPVSKAFDLQRNPTKTAEGFCRRYVVPLDSMFRKADVQVRFVRYEAEDDEWVNVKKAVREQSISFEHSECNKVSIGNLVLCLQERRDQSNYYDAHVVKIDWKMQDIRGCKSEDSEFTCKHKHLSSVPVDSRSRLRPPLGNNFTGNAFVLASVSCSVKTLLEQPLHDTVRRIQSPKDEISDEYIKLYAKALEASDKFPPSMQQLTIVSDWWRFTFDDLDFGWGKVLNAAILTTPVPETAFLMVILEEPGGGFLVRIGIGKQYVHDLITNFNNLSYM